MARATAAQRGYGGRWQKARASYLLSHPWCRMCLQDGRYVMALHLDHIKPHQGDQARFWDKANWQPLCETHHNRDKQQIETRGYRDAVGADGLPIDPNHPFNRTCTDD